MRLVFDGFETPIDLEPGCIATLQIENGSLFSRVVQSLASLEGRVATEPYSLWDDGVEMKPSASLLLATDPMRLPWDDRALMGEVMKRIEREFLEDEDVRREVEKLDTALASRLLEIGFGMHSEYGYGLEWDVKRYLKFRGFDVAVQGSEPFFDKLIRFLSLVLDARCKKTIVFVNLKTFLTKNDVQELCDYVFRSKMSILLLENKRDRSMYNHERKICIDLDFLETEKSESQVDRLFAVGDFAPTVLEQCQSDW